MNDRRISNTSYTTAACDSYGNWQVVYSAEQNTHSIEVGYNNLNEVGTVKCAACQRDVTKDS